MIFDLPGHGQSEYSEDILTTVREAVQKIQPKPLCIGYSLGGRIALQMQELFQAIIAISVHLGLPTKQERDKRRLADKQWSQKLLQLPLEQFFIEWYSQPIFQSLVDKPILLQAWFKRRMKQNPENMAKVILQMSLADQRVVDNFYCPVLFLYGEQDLKYQQMYSKLPKTIEVQSIKNSGHAVHIENAAECSAQIFKWMEALHVNT